MNISKLIYRIFSAKTEKNIKSVDKIANPKIQNLNKDVFLSSSKSYTKPSRYIPHPLDAMGGL